MKDYNLFTIITVVFKETTKGYAKLYVRKITDIAMLLMQNEGCRTYLDIQNVIGRIGLLRSFDFH